MLASLRWAEQRALLDSPPQPQRCCNCACNPRAGSTTQHSASMQYCLQELLLSYGDSYWPVEGPKLRRKHEAYAARAAQVRLGCMPRYAACGLCLPCCHVHCSDAHAPLMLFFCHPVCQGVNCARFPPHPCSLQAIAAVHAALESAGAPPADLAACLAPVDLAAGEHRFYEAFSLD